MLKIIEECYKSLSCFVRQSVLAILIFLENVSLVLASLLGSCYPCYYYSLRNHWPKTSFMVFFCPWGLGFESFQTTTLDIMCKRQTFLSIRSTLAKFISNINIIIKWELISEKQHSILYFSNHEAFGSNHIHEAYPSTVINMNKF